MSNEWFDVGQFQKRNEKWSFQRLGSARQNDKGGWDVYLNALPLTMEGQCRISIQPQREKDTGVDDVGLSRRGRPTGGGVGYSGPDDDIPFGPEWRV